MDDNFLSATMADLDRYEIIPSDIKRVGHIGGNYVIPWIDFCDLAEHTPTHADLPEDLVIVLKNGDFLMLDECHIWRYVTVPKERISPACIYYSEGSTLEKWYV